MTTFRRLLRTTAEPIRTAARRIRDGLRARRMEVRSRLRRRRGVVRRIRVLDWRGNCAAGDDLLGHCVRRVFGHAADDSGIRLEFADDDNADLVVIGGGTLLGPKVPAISAALGGPRVPLVIFGTGYRGTSKVLCEEEAAEFRAILRRASLVGVRGELTRERCLASGGIDVEVIGDPGLSFVPKIGEGKSDRFDVGVMVRSMGKTGEPQYLDNESTFAMIAEIADHFVEEHSATIRFVPLAENEHDSDREGALAVIDRMRHGTDERVVVEDGLDDPILAFSRVASMDYVISQRLHPTVIAWLAGKPCVAFDYQFQKTADFMGSLGMEEFVLRTDDYRLEEYLRLYEEVRRRRQQLAGDVERRVDRWRTRQLEFASEALELIR